MRWGLTEELRRPYRLDGFAQNTWQAGLDRVLLGVVMADDGAHTLGATLPLDDVGSGAVDLAGRLAELVDRLEASVLRLRAATSLTSWVEALRDGVGALGSTSRADAWQVAQLERELRLRAGRRDGLRVSPRAAAGRRPHPAGAAGCSRVPPAPTSAPGT